MADNFNMWKPPSPSNFFDDEDDPYAKIDDPYVELSPRGIANKASANSWYLLPQGNVEGSPIATEEAVEEKFFCKVCKKTMYSIEAYQEHVITQEHITQAAKYIHADVPKNNELNKDNLLNYCELCGISCTGVRSYEAHIAGTKHKKKLKLKNLEELKVAAAKEAAEKKVDYTNLRPISRRNGEELPSMVMDEIMKSTEALIGIEFLSEIQLTQAEPPRFYCEVCDANFENNIKIPHLTGVRHRIRVLKKKDYPMAMKVQASCEKKSVLTKRLAEIAKSMEYDEGRGKVKVITEAEYNIWNPAGNVSLQKNTEGVTLPFHNKQEVQPVPNRLVARFCGSEIRLNSTNGHNDSENNQPDRSTSPYHMDTSQTYEKETEEKNTSGRRTTKVEKTFETVSRTMTTEVKVSVVEDTTKTTLKEDSYPDRYRDQSKSPQPCKSPVHDRTDVQRSVSPEYYNENRSPVQRTSSYRSKSQPRTKSSQVESHFKSQGSSFSDSSRLQSNSPVQDRSRLRSKSPLQDRSRLHSKSPVQDRRKHRKGTPPRSRSPVRTSSQKKSRKLPMAYRTPDRKSRSTRSPSVESLKSSRRRTPSPSEHSPARGRSSQRKKSHKDRKQSHSLEEDLDTAYDRIKNRRACVSPPSPVHKKRGTDCEAEETIKSAATRTVKDISHFTVVELLGGLSKHTITVTSESEAVLMYNVSNALTEALLKYRLRNNASENTVKLPSENNLDDEAVGASSMSVCVQEQQQQGEQQQHEQHQEKQKQHITSQEQEEEQGEQQEWLQLQQQQQSHQKQQQHRNNGTRLSAPTYKTAINSILQPVKVNPSDDITHPMSSTTTVTTDSNLETTTMQSNKRLTTEEFIAQKMSKYYNEVDIFQQLSTPTGVADNLPIARIMKANRKTANTINFSTDSELNNSSTSAYSSDLPSFESIFSSPVTYSPITSFTTNAVTTVCTANSLTDANCPNSALYSSLNTRTEGSASLDVASRFARVSPSTDVISPLARAERLLSSSILPPGIRKLMQETVEKKQGKR